MHNELTEDKLIIYFSAILSVGGSRGPDLWIRPALKAALKAEYEARDEYCPDGDDFARGGRWHRAVNRLQFALQKRYEEVARLRSGPNDLRTLSLGDWSFEGIMNYAVEISGAHVENWWWVK